MPNFKTLQFPNTSDGQRAKVDVLKIYSDSGWTMISEILEPGRFDGNGSQLPAMITLTFSSEGSVIPELANLSLLDPLILDAAKAMIETGKTGTSILQRKLKVGYGRAARLIEQLERIGVVKTTRGKTELVDKTQADLERRIGGHHW